MTIQSTVLIGNGINRWIKDNPVVGDNYQISWKSTLELLAQRAQYDVRDIDQKPLTLVFDELIWGCTEFCVNGLMTGNRRTSRSGYDRKYKESSTQRPH